MKPLIGISVFFCAFIGSGFQSASAQAANPSRIHQLKSLKVAKLRAAGHAIDAWVMDTESKDQEGMMFLTDREVRQDQGMLFLFPMIQTADKGFWMHNTLIPLDIVYISASKKVVSISAGKIQDDTTLYPKGPYLYVVELKQGTAKKFGIKAGTKWEIPATLKWAE